MTLKLTSVEFILQVREGRTWESGEERLASHGRALTPREGEEESVGVVTASQSQPAIDGPPPTRLARRDPRVEKRARRVVGAPHGTGRS